MPLVQKNSYVKGAYLRVVYPTPLQPLVSNYYTFFIELAFKTKQVFSLALGRAGTRVRQVEPSLQL